MSVGVFGTVSVTIFGEKRMRIIKLALVTGLAVFVATGSAQAITVKKRTEAPGLPPEIWQVVAGFCAIKDWHPAVASCEPDRSVILWQSDFDANGASDAEAKNVITGILADGVKGIKKAAIEAWDKKHPGEAQKDQDEDDKN